MNPSSHASSPRTYLLIWVWLAGLMLLSVVLSELNLLPLSVGALAFLVMVLSTIKALLVALYYMHLKVDRRLLAGVAVFPFLLITLAVVVVLSSRLVRL